MPQTDQQTKRAIELEDDPIFSDLLVFARENMGRATHDSLIRFKWAKYEYAAGVAAVSFVMAHLLAVLNRNITITPEEVGEIVKEAVIKVRAEPPEEDDNDD